MAPKSVTFRRHDHLVSVLFGDLLSHSYNITFSMFLYLVSGWLEEQTIVDSYCMDPILKDLNFFVLCIHKGVSNCSARKVSAPQPLSEIKTLDNY